MMIITVTIASIKHNINLAHLVEFYEDTECFGSFNRLHIKLVNGTEYVTSNREEIDAFYDFMQYGPAGRPGETNK